MVVEADVRVGDAERRGVDTQLQQACGDGLLSLSEYDERSAAVWSARTRGELAAVLADLPAGTIVPAPSPQRVLTPAGAKPSTEHTIAVMGNSVVDLRRGDLPARTTVTATAIMGNVLVLVPEGVRVESNGLAIMGNRQVNVVPPVPGAPVVKVHAISLMGHVEVRHQSLTRKDRALGRAASVGESAPVAARERRPSRGRKKHGGRYFLGVAILATAVVGGLEAFHGDTVSIFGDRTVSVSSGQVDLGSVFGDMTVKVPSDVNVVVTGTQVFGDVNGSTAGAGKTVTIRDDNVFGDLKIVRTP